ncbi:cobalamin biosynthesis protein CobW [Gordonia sp. TBRC 11910]|uniref:Cobalamin biosynthesis protein CobW n=1 Tax=Gordonia asplenii TaxID=2725283 RepID=A0A848KVY3_9ACTN|nr:GTP-binding protein [Gordonia asplenii]NMO00613.1 cobalamin biosynthesis protein CobW [Gordonia asplenii]
MPEFGRTPVVLVAGLDADATARTANALVVAGVTLVHHDLSRLEEGVVVATVRSVDLAGDEHATTTELVLDHGCVSCTLRAHLLPMLRRLHRRSSVESIVVQLDPAMEPERVSWAISHVVVADMPGFADAAAGADVCVRATITCVAEDSWLTAATGDEELPGAPDDDERTLAQVAVGQVRFADALVVAGCDPVLREPWESARLMAVLRRLVPRAPMMIELPQRRVTPILLAQLMTAIPPNSRRGRVSGPHDPLLSGQPPLDEDCGVRLVEFNSDRPFHPQRLHEAVDALLDGVVSAQGRLWLATHSADALWLDSAGGGLRIGSGAPWLAALEPDERSLEDPVRVAMSALRWDPVYGDRHSAVVVLVHRPDAGRIQHALRAACLTDAEMAGGPELWDTFDDPFGMAHVDPCDDIELSDPSTHPAQKGEKP